MNVHLQRQKYRDPRCSCVASASLVSSSPGPFVCTNFMKKIPRNGAVICLLPASATQSLSWTLRPEESIRCHLLQLLYAWQQGQGMDMLQLPMLLGRWQPTVTICIKHPGAIVTLRTNLPQHHIFQVKPGQPQLQ